MLVAQYFIFFVSFHISASFPQHEFSLFFFFCWAWLAIVPLVRRSHPMCWHCFLQIALPGVVKSAKISSDLTFTGNWTSESLVFFVTFCSLHQAWFKRKTFALIRRHSTGAQWIFWVNNSFGAMFGGAWKSMFQRIADLFYLFSAPNYITVWHGEFRGYFVVFYEPSLCGRVEKCRDLLTF